MVNAALESSPTSDHFDMNGNFSEDDIQHLLGVMNATHEDAAQGVPNPVMQAAVETAACLAPSENSHHNTTSSNIQNETIHEEAKALARSERKRSREKQRRLDVNKQFTDLTKLVAQIEQEEREEDPTVFRQSFSATNRADLIARAISHMERLRDVNKRRKLENDNLQQQLQESQKAGEDIAAKYKEALCKNNGMMMMPQPNKPVMMMVPMMMPSNTAQGMTQFGMQGMGAMNQFMMPQAFMPQPAAAPTAAAVPQQQQQQQLQPQQHSQAPSQAQPTQQQLQPQQHSQAPPQQQHSQAPQLQPQQQPAQPQQVPTMMTPQQMMFTSMQNVYPTMMDPNAAATMTAPAPMPYFAAAAPAAPSAEHKTDDAATQPQQSQQPPPSNGQGNSSSSSAGGSNYAHCA